MDWSLIYFLGHWLTGQVKQIDNIVFEISKSEPHIVLKSWSTSSLIWTSLLKALSNMILELPFEWPAILNLNYVMDWSLTFFLGPYIDRICQTDRQYWILNQSLWTSDCSEILINGVFNLNFIFAGAFLKSWSKMILEWPANWPAILNLNYNKTDQTLIYFPDP